MKQVIKIGTRDSQLAVWQATLVQKMLKQHGVESEQVYIKSEGDLDMVTPLYEFGVQGISLLNVDEISVILDKTITLRQAEIPKAMAVINITINDLMEWYHKQSNNPLLRRVKTQLYELSEIHFTDQFMEEKIHKAVSSLAIQLQNQNNKGCQCINALSTYLHMN